MTDLVKMYKPAAAKAIVTKRGEGTVVQKGDVAAIIEHRKYRAAPINMPVLPATQKVEIFALCDKLHAEGLDYKMLRRAVLDHACMKGYENAASYVSRWRHRFN